MDRRAIEDTTGARMNRKTSTLNLVVEAALKLDARTPEWRNVMGFVESCYCGLVRNYDLDDAVASLNKLTDQEQHALIAWVMLLDEVSGTNNRGRA
jgi:hypothetical protein